MWRCIRLGGSKCVRICPGDNPLGLSMDVRSTMHLMLWELGTLFLRLCAMCCSRPRSCGCRTGLSVIVWCHDFNLIRVGCFATVPPLSPSLSRSTFNHSHNFDVFVCDFIICSLCAFVFLLYGLTRLPPHCSSLTTHLLKRSLHTCTLLWFIFIRNTSSISILFSYLFVLYCIVLCSLLYYARLLLCVMYLQIAEFQISIEPLY